MPIVVTNLNYTYLTGSPGAHIALSDISLTINEGEFLGIIGHTGSGKSTLVQHLNGLIQPESGSVAVDGLDLSEKRNRRAARQKVGVVFQYPEYQLFEETVLRDIAYGPKNLGLSEEEAMERAKEAMRLVGLSVTRFAQKSPFELSGGEKRRAALAGTIAMRPKYLVLDEPMAGLDPRGRRSILEMIESLREETGCAVIMVTHSMDDIAKTASRIAVLQGGCLVMTGTPEEVFKNPEKLAEMGLDIPQASRLAFLLKSRGILINTPIYEIEHMERFVCERLNKPC